MPPLAHFPGRSQYAPETVKPISLSKSGRSRFQCLESTSEAPNHQGNRNRKNVCGAEPGTVSRTSPFTRLLAVTGGAVQRGAGRVCVASMAKLLAHAGHARTLAVPAGVILRVGVTKSVPPVKDAGRLLANWSDTSPSTGWSANDITVLPMALETTAKRSADNSWVPLWKVLVPIGRLKHRPTSPVDAPVEFTFKTAETAFVPTLPLTNASTDGSKFRLKPTALSSPCAANNTGTRLVCPARSPNWGILTSRPPEPVA